MRAKILNNEEEVIIEKLDEMISDYIEINKCRPNYIVCDYYTHIKLKQKAIKMIDDVRRTFYFEGGSLEKYQGIKIAVCETNPDGEVHIV